MGRVAHTDAEGLSLAVQFPSCRACASAPRAHPVGTLSMRLSDLAIAEAVSVSATKSCSATDDPTADAAFQLMAGRCRFTVSNPELKARMVSAISA